MPAQNRRLTTAALLVLMLALIVAQRLWTYAEPLERDIVTYALIGREMLKGRDLYSDLWDIKPPLIYATFAAAQAVAGSGRLPVFLVNVLAASVVLGGIFCATRRLTRSRSAALLAAALWVCVGASPSLQANQPNTELFINACMAWGLFLLLKDRMSWREIVGVGLLFLAASLYKTVTVAWAAVIALAMIALPPPGVSRRTALWQVIAMACVGIVGWGVVFAWFHITGRFPIFWRTVFEYGGGYAGDIPSNLLNALRPSRLLPPIAWPMLLALLPALLAMVHGARRNAQRQPWMMFIAFSIGAWLVRALPGQSHWHYYQLYLIPACVGAGAFAVTVIPAGRLRTLYATLLLLSLFALEGVYRLHSPVEISRRKYGDIFYVSEEMSGELQRWMRPSETLFHWGDEPNFYYLSGEDLPSGIFWSNHAIYGALAEENTQRLLKDLGERPPDVVVEDEMTRNVSLANRVHPVQQWIEQNYVPMPYGHERGIFLIYLRKGSDILRRMTAIGPPYSLRDGILRDNYAKRDVPLEQRAIDGSIDWRDLSGGQFTLNGWMRLREKELPIKALLLFEDGELLAVDAPNQLRPDVPSAYGPAFCGFYMTVPAKTQSQLQTYALGWDGVATRFAEAMTTGSQAEATQPAD